MTKPSAPQHAPTKEPAADELRRGAPGPSSEAADVQLTRGGKDSESGEAAHRDAQLPHERDQHPDSQGAPEAPNTAVGEQAFRDVSHGLVDTDESLRKSAVDRRDGQHAQPAGRVTQPRQATLDGQGGGKQ